MKSVIITAVAMAALLLPASVVAQDESPEASMGPIGVTTFDVCLAISGPVIQLTPEALTEGIADGTFVIEGLSTDCDTGLMGADASAEPTADDTEGESATESNG